MSLESGSQPSPAAETEPESPVGGPVTGSPDREPEQREQPGQAPPAPLPQHKLRRTRVSAAWFAMGAFALVLLLLLIFILQNNHTVEISYLGAHGHLPLGVAVLLAAVGGVLLTVLVGAARIIQLRATALRHRQNDAKATAKAP